MKNMNVSTVLSETGAISPAIVILVCAIALILFTTLIVIVSRYKKCPSDKIMVIYGAAIGNNHDGTPRTAKCIHGGAAFVVPIFQSYEYMDLTPMSISVYAIIEMGL